MKTIAKQIKWNFKTNGKLEIKNKNDKPIYFEDSSGYWAKREYNSDGNQIYYEDSDGFGSKWEHDSKGNTIYFESSSGFWEKMEYDSEGNQTYYENSYGRIVDERPKPYENKIVEIEGIKYKLTKI